jgi:DNA repair exonuclease SbcCD ATPase subunit
MSESNKVNFKYIKARNFLSIGDEIIFDFGKHHGINYIFGSNLDVKDNTKNGCGKSSLFVDAILFGLFGRTSKKISKPNVVNRLKGKDCLVTLYITVNNDEYIIENGVLPTYCKVTKNGEDITKSSIKETQDYLTTEVLRTTYTIFKNSIILSVNDTTSIFQMKRHEKREFIEKIFNLSIFGEMYKLVKDDFNNLEKDILLEQNTYNRLVNSIDEFEMKHLTFNETNHAELDKILEQIADLQNKSESLECDTTEYHAGLVKINNAINKLKDKRTEVSNTNSKIITGIQYMEKNLSEKEKVLKKYEDIYEMVCDICQPKLDKMVNFSENQKNISELKTKIQQYQDREDRLSTDILKLDSKLSELLEKESELNLAIRDCENNKQKIEYGKERIISLQELAETTRQKESPFKELIDKYTTDKLSTYSKLEEQLDQKKYLQYLLYALSEDGVKKWIVSNLINTLNSRIKKYLEEMGAEYTVIFDPNFEYRFLTTTGECEYDNFSAGERMRLNHSVLFAVKDILNAQGTLSSSILVCDELLDVSVDNIAIQALMSILKRQAEGQTVYLISHKESVANSDSFDNVIELKKENGYTSIVSDPQAEAGEQSLPKI